MNRREALAMLGGGACLAFRLDVAIRQRGLAPPGPRPGAQERTRGLEWDVAVFTNLTQDHLDYHGTMEDYFEAKAKLFAQLPLQAMTLQCTG